MYKELTKEQLDKFYGQYVTLKSKKYAGKILSKQTFKDNIEMDLNRSKPNQYWTQSDIRKSMMGNVRYGAWTSKQKETLKRNFTKDDERVKAFEKRFGKKIRYEDAEGNVQYDTTLFGHWLDDYEGWFFSFLQDYEGDNWNEIFDS